MLSAADWTAMAADVALVRGDNPVSITLRREAAMTQESGDRGQELEQMLAAQSGWKYQIGDEMVDKSGLGSKLREQAAHLQKQNVDFLG